MVWMVFFVALMYPFVWAFMSKMDHYSLQSVAGTNNQRAVAASAAQKEIEEEEHEEETAATAALERDPSSLLDQRRLRQPPSKEDLEKFEYQDDFFVQALEKNGCHIVENVCIPQPRANQQQGVWFYHPKYNSSRQPNLAVETKWIRAKRNQPDPPTKLQMVHFNLYPQKNISPNQTFCWMNHDNSKEQIQNHIIVTSAYLHMMMEFYTRVPAGLWEIYQQSIPPAIKSSASKEAKRFNASISPNNEEEEEEDTVDRSVKAMTLAVLRATSRYYIHVSKTNRKTTDQPSLLLPGMHPLMKTFSDYPLQSLYDLVVQPNSTSNGDQEEDDQPQSCDCQCLPRIILCGYKQPEVDKNSKIQERTSPFFDTVLTPVMQIGRMRKTKKNESSHGLGRITTRCH
jgi:hypothetical protein